MVQTTTPTIPAAIAQAIAEYRFEPVEDTAACIRDGFIEVGARLASGEIIDDDIAHVAKLVASDRAVLVGRWDMKRDWLTIGEQKFVRADLPAGAPTWAEDVVPDVFHDGTLIRQFVRNLARSNDADTLVVLERMDHMDASADTEETVIAYIGREQVEFRDTATMRAVAGLLLASADKWDEVAGWAGA